MKKLEHDFCMSRFKPAIACLVVLIIMVLIWSISTCDFGNLRRQHGMVLAAAAVNPPAGNIKVKTVMNHPYWGNCNKCHITTNPPSQPVSKAFAGGPIDVNAPQPHEYWGNCNLCHQVTGGFQPAAAKPRGNGNARLAAAAPGVPGPISPTAKAPHADWGQCKNCHQIVQGGAPVAFKRLSADSLGLQLQNVTGVIMQKFALADEEGVLVLSVQPDSLAGQAGLAVGDEIVRVNRHRIDTIDDFNLAVSIAKPGDVLKITLYRGKKSRNIFIRLPAASLVATLNGQNLPMTQNRIETLAEQLGVPKTQQAVQQAQQQPTLIVKPNRGKVVIAATGPGVVDRVASSFEASPYFIVFDPVSNKYSSVANPNYNDQTGSAVQTSQYMVDLGGINILAGSFSTDSYNTLRSQRLNVFPGVTGSVKNIITMYLAGRIQPAALRNNPALQQQVLSQVNMHPPQIEMQVPAGQSAPVRAIVF